MLQVCSENGVTCRVMEASEAGSIPMEQMKTVGLKPEDDDESDDDDDEEEEEEDLPCMFLFFVFLLNEQYVAIFLIDLD